jgi:hypothetical protein
MKDLIKQDINFLDKPLWFQNPRHDGLGVVWDDIEGYEYRSGYKLPDKVDMLILFYLILKLQHIDYQAVLEISKYEILKACGFSTSNPKYYKRIEESLKRWVNIAITFHGTFYDSDKYIAIGFHIIDSYEFDAKNRRVCIRFNPDWVSKIRESGYFKYIKFGYYKGLKRPTSRRLYEILCKSFVGRDKWSIRLTLLGTKMTLQGREVHIKTGVKKMIYASDVLVAIKPAVNEINSWSSSPEVLKEIWIKPTNLFTLTYKITGEKQSRVITFYHHPVMISKVEGCVEKEQPQQEAIETETVRQEQEEQLNPQNTDTGVENHERRSEDQDLQALLQILKTRTSQLERIVAKHLERKGFESVRWSILYANEHSQKNYSAYLKEVLSNNWAEEWAIEKKKEQACQAEKKEVEARRKEEEQRQREIIQKEVKRQRAIFKQKVEDMDPKVKIELWDLAKRSVPYTSRMWELGVKNYYGRLVLEYFNSHGEDFMEEVVKDSILLEELALEKSLVRRRGVSHKESESGIGSEYKRREGEGEG